MNQDPVYERLREIAWRRPLTETEQAELRAWLLAHPEAQADWDAEVALNSSLAKLPVSPVSSNFTARVLQQIELAERASTQSPQRTRPWWHSFLPRMAMVGLVLMVGIGGWHHYASKQHRLTEIASEVATAELLANPEALADFEEIYALMPVTPDESLLALSEELIALNQ